MLQLRRSLSRQSKPSTLTAGLLPKFTLLTHPPGPFLADDEGDEANPEGIGMARGDTGDTLSSPKRSSWISGLDTLLGGDPQKNGGDEATCAADWSTPTQPCQYFQNYKLTVESKENFTMNERILFVLFYATFFVFQLS